MAFRSGVPARELGELPWRKSSASNPSGNCVELAARPDGGVAVRNSRDPAGPALVYTAPSWRPFWPGPGTASLTTWRPEMSGDN
jgi:Domain of unknown function (DUF397)